MKIAVICANGKAGKLIVKEAVNRGLDVTAVVRGDNETAAREACTSIRNIPHVWLTVRTFRMASNRWPAQWQRRFLNFASAGM